MPGNLYWNPAMDSNKSEELRKTGWPGHVWARGWTFLILLTGIRLGSWICSDFLEKLVQESFSMICTSPTHLMHLP
jgi:hypothetical protein